MGRSRSRSVSRKRSRSRRKSRSRKRSRSRRRSRTRSFSEEEEYGTRLHIADLAPDVNKREIEKECEKFGTIIDMWLARNPPCFGFVVYKHKVDAFDAMDSLNGK